MDPKDIKANLKEAKDSIQRKDYLTTINCCKNVLKLDPSNYNAYVFLAAAYTEQAKYQQAIEACKKAIAINPDVITGWAGLVKSYEKMGTKTHADLFEGYKKLSTFYEKDDTAKYVESTLKFVGLLISQSDFEKALKVLHRLVNSKFSSGMSLQVGKLIVEVMGQIKNPKIDYTNIHIMALEAVLDDTLNEKNLKKLFELIYSTGDKGKLISKCLELRNSFNMFYPPIEWLCRMYLETRGNDLSYASEIDSFVEKLLKLYPSSAYGYFAKGKAQFYSQEYKSAIYWLLAALESSQNIYAIEILIESQLKMWDYSSALNSATSALKKIPQNDLVMKKKFNVYIFETKVGLALQGKYNDFDLETEEKFCKDSTDDQVRIELIKLKYLTGTKNWDKLKEVIPLNEKSMDMNEKLVYKLLADNSGKDVGERIFSMCVTDIRNFQLVFTSAYHLFHLDDIPASLSLLKRAEACQPKHPMPLFYQGIILEREDKIEDAVQYYEKAYTLYSSVQIGEVLSDAYFKIQEYELNRELLSNSTKRLKKSESKWAWLRLGLLHLELGEGEEAVVAFQSAIRTEYYNGYIWQCLADAYFMRGSYSSALKAFQHAIELGADPVYPEFKIGVIHQNLGDFDSAINALMKLKDSYPPTLIEIAKTFYEMARKNLDEDLDIGASIAINNGIKYAVLSLKSNREVLGWKLIGDFSILVNDFPIETTFEIPEILSNGSGSFEKIVNVNLKTLLHLGIECYKNALKEVEGSERFSKELKSTLYFDLAKSYFYQAHRFEDVGTELLAKSFLCAKKAISLNKENHVYWNTLGVIAQKRNDYSLAQHAFCKSIELEANNVTAWCNLGFLYLIFEKYLLAHNCFKKAQTMEPTYGYAWIGQAVTAEILQPDEAMDLYRHAALLVNANSMSTLAYSEAVCNYIKNVEEKSQNYKYNILDLEAPIVAFDLLSKFVVRNSKNISALNSRGLLATKLGLNKAANSCFEDALKFITPGSPMEDKIRFNSAIVKIQGGMTDKALEELRLIKDPNFQTQAATALAYSKLKQFDESEVIYKKLLEETLNEKEKPNLLIPLAFLEYSKNDLEAARNYLFQSCRVEKSLDGLLALCSIALLTNDCNLARGVVEPLSEIQDEGDNLSDLALMKACSSIVQGQGKKALYEITKAARFYPFNSTIWITMAHHLLNFHREEPKLGDFIQLCVSNSMKLVVDKVGKQRSLLALSAILLGNFDKGLAYALKATRLEPDNAKNWTLVATTLFIKSMTTKNTSTIGQTKRLLNIANQRREPGDLDLEVWIDRFTVHLESFP